jgi:hypothetical protein
MPSVSTAAAGRRRGDNNSTSGGGSTTPSNLFTTGLQSIVSWGKHQTRGNQKSSPSANIITMEDAKRVEKDLAGEYDDNDQFFRRHLQQLHFSHLPFGRVTQRIDASRTTLDRLVKYARRSVSAHESAVKHAVGVRQSLSEARDNELPGSILDALARLTHVAHKNEDAELEMAKQVKAGLLTQLKLLTKAHEVHSNALMSKHAALVKGLQQANARHGVLREALRVAVRDRDSARRRWERVMHEYAVSAAAAAEAAESGVNSTTSGSGSVMRTNSGDANDMAVAQAKAVWIRTDASVSRLEEQVKQDGMELRRLRVHSQLEAEAVALEAQGSEQHRVDAVKISLCQHMREQLSRLDQQRALIEETLVSVEQNVDSSFDARLFSHVCVVEDYLSGEAASTDVADNVGVGCGRGGNRRMAAADSMLVPEENGEGSLLELTDVEDDGDDDDDDGDLDADAEVYVTKSESQAGGDWVGVHEDGTCDAGGVNGKVKKKVSDTIKQQPKRKHRQRTSSLGVALTPNKQVDEYLRWIWAVDTTTAAAATKSSDDGDDSEAPSSIPHLCNLLDQASVRRHLLRSLNSYRTSREPLHNRFDDLVVLIGTFPLLTHFRSITNPLFYSSSHTLHLLIDMLTLRLPMIRIP